MNDRLVEALEEMEEASQDAKKQAQFLAIEVVRYLTQTEWVIDKRGPLATSFRKSLANIAATVYALRLANL